MSKTNAQLAAELAELQATIATLTEANQKLRTQTTRKRFTASLFENPTSTPENKQPAWRGPIRLIMPKDAKPGEHIWFDCSQWPADPDRFESDNVPTYSLSLTVTDPEFAAELEKRHQAWLKTQVARQTAA